MGGNKDTPLFAAIPFSLIDAAGDGDITQSMLAVMVFLYRWAKWETGRVKRTSAPAIASWCQGKWSEKTIQDAMLRLERQGYITRENTPGSHETYPVVIHNYVAKVRRPVVGPDRQAGAGRGRAGRHCGEHGADKRKADGDLGGGAAGGTAASLR
jgi:hypothetical protein